MYDSGSKDEIVNIKDLSAKTDIEFGNFSELLKIAIKSIEDRLNITPIKEFSTNYTELYCDSKGAADKLLAKNNVKLQVLFIKKSWAIYLVWENEQIGLNKILSKHEGDFDELGGVANGLERIVKEVQAVTAQSGI